MHNGEYNAIVAKMIITVYTCLCRRTVHRIVTLHICIWQFLDTIILLCARA